MTPPDRIKVLNITEEGRGGGAMYRISMVADHSRETIASVVVVPKSATKYIQSLKQKRITVSPLRLHPLTRDFSGLLLYLVFFIPEIISLYRLIKREKPAVIHANGSWQYKGIIAARLAKTPSIWHMNDMWQPESIKRVFKLLSWLPTAYIFASERTQEYYTSISPKIASKISDIVPAPVDIHRYQTQKNGLDNNRINVANVGYINAHKGLETLIKVANEVGDQYEFHIYGPVLDSQKVYFQSLEKLQGQLQVTNITWHGFTDDVPAQLSKMDSYICTSRRESSPMAVWEALAAGLPVISTDVGDVKQIVQQYNCGSVVPIEDHHALANALRALTQPQNEGVALATNARQAASEQFSLDSVCKRYLSFLNAMMSSRT